MKNFLICFVFTLLTINGFSQWEVWTVNLSGYDYPWAFTTSTNDESRLVLFTETGGYELFPQLGGDEVSNEGVLLYLTSLAVFLADDVCEVDFSFFVDGQQKVHKLKGRVHDYKKSRLMLIVPQDGESDAEYDKIWSAEFLSDFRNASVLKLSIPKYQYNYEFSMSGAANAYERVSKYKEAEKAFYENINRKYKWEVKTTDKPYEEAFVSTENNEIELCLAPESTHEGLSMFISSKSGWWDVSEFCYANLSFFVNGQWKKYKLKGRRDNNYKIIKFASLDSWFDDYDKIWSAEFLSDFRNASVLKLSIPDRKEMNYVFSMSGAANAYERVSKYKEAEKAFYENINRKYKWEVKTTDHFSVEAFVATENNEIKLCLAPESTHEGLSMFICSNNSLLSVNKVIIDDVCNNEFSFLVNGQWKKYKLKGIRTEDYDKIIFVPSGGSSDDYDKIWSAEFLSDFKKASVLTISFPHRFKSDEETNIVFSMSGAANAYERAAKYKDVEKSFYDRINSLVKVSFVKKETVTNAFGEYIVFDVNITNNSNKAINGCAVKVTFKNGLGEKIKEAEWNLPMDEPIKAYTTGTARCHIKRNKYDREDTEAFSILAASSINQLKITCNVVSVIYADGTVEKIKY